MQRVRRWAAIAGILGGLWGLGLACGGFVTEEPNARERAARSAVLRNLLASREKAPEPQELQSQRRELQTEVHPDEEGAKGGSGQARAAASVKGTVAWVGDDELLVRDTSGMERELLVQDDTRFLRGERQVSRRAVEQGAEIRASYDVLQGEWVAREVELLRAPAVPAPLLIEAP
ncbi:MAG TPA: hypothetical protein VNA24_31255 [Hyalangium sp.]|jgi:hypothetical protein|nr:hypothetical protein [Hyalangium sp.]